MMIAASTRCAFKVGKQFKEMLCAKTPEPEAVVEETPTLEAPVTAAPAMETPTLEPAQPEVAETAEVAETEEVAEPTTSQWSYTD
jgi:hypothetical protein